MKMSRGMVVAAAVFALGAGGTAARAEDLTFTLINKTHATMLRFYTSPVGVNDWEEDVFGKDVLDPGDEMDVTIADGRTVCNYDMRFEFDDDSTTEDTVNLCDLGSYTIHE